MSIKLGQAQSFRQERELRAIIDETPSTEVLKSSEPENVLGKNIPVDLQKLIIRIYIAPTSTSWFFELVKSVSAKYRLTKEIIQSALDAKPYF